MRIKKCLYLFLVVLIISFYQPGHSAAQPVEGAVPIQESQPTAACPDLCSCDSCPDAAPQLELARPALPSMTETSLPDSFDSIQFGSGTITLALDASIPVEYRQYINDLFLDLYPAMLLLFGPAAYSRTVTVLYTSSPISACYYNDKIALGRLPAISLPYSAENPTDSAFDYAFLSELVEAFQYPIQVSLPRNWAGAGMQTAGTELISLYLSDYGIRNMPASPGSIIRSYDSINTMGPEILGGFT